MELFEYICKKKNKKNLVWLIWYYLQIMFWLVKLECWLQDLFLQFISWDSGQQTISVKSHMVNIFGFVGGSHCYNYFLCCARAVTANTQKNRCIYFLIKLYKYTLKSEFHIIFIYLIYYFKLLKHINYVVKAKTDGRSVLI